MLPHFLFLLSVSQVPLLGEVGESCRSDRDCEAALACVRSVCAPKPIAAEQPRPIEKPVGPRDAPPLPVLPPSQPDEVAADVPSEVPEEPLHFSGIHLFVGVSAGAGPMRINASQFLSSPIRGGFFEGSAVTVPLELRVGLLFGRFEAAIEGSPSSTVISGTQPTLLSSAALSVGWLFKLYETADLSLYLPLRGHLGLTHQASSEAVGPSGGGAVGVGLRVKQLLFEARGGVTYTMSWGTWSWTGLSVPFTVAVSVVF